MEREVYNRYRVSKVLTFSNSEYLAEPSRRTFCCSNDFTITENSSLTSTKISTYSARICSINSKAGRSNGLLISIFFFN